MSSALTCHFPVCCTEQWRREFKWRAGVLLNSGSRIWERQRGGRVKDKIPEVTLYQNLLPSLADFSPPLADFWMAHVQSETQGTEQKATAGRSKIWAEILAPCCWTGRAWSWSPAKSEAYDKHLRLSTGIPEGSRLRSGIGKLFCKGPDSNILGFVG